jgi:hypothetical protein
MGRMLTLTESTRLLHMVFPNYPDLRPKNPVPPEKTWHVTARDLYVDESPNGPRYFVAGEPVSLEEFKRIQRAVTDDAISSL